MDDETVIICARADNPTSIPGSDFSRVCSECKSRVMVAPSGVRLLNSNTALIIRCDVCFFNGPYTGEKIELAASIEETVSEMSTAMPNFWRTRN